MSIGAQGPTFYAFEVPKFICGTWKINPNENETVVYFY